jgi:hypothetical protein
MTDEVQVAKSRRRREPGRVVRIPLGDGRCAHARQLVGGVVAFFDHVVDCADVVDIREVVTWPLAFEVSVMDLAFRASSGWDLLDVVPLSDAELARTYRSFKQDALNGALSIYWRRADDSWGEDPATREECEGLERMAIWDAHHVEDRLRAHFDGRTDRWTESLRLR